MLKISGYSLKSKLGTGGMAVVYLATQDSLGREVALKVMKDVSETEQNQKERFIHEGHDLASLQHHNIVTIHDISTENECHYYAMELLKYGSLHDRIREGISLRDAIEIVLQVGSALEYAHQNNIIHRDLKPDNILFRDPDTPVLTDFGIAKNRQRETHLTTSGGLLGTPCYMSPEQCRGSNVNSRSDQYSLCILFFELITGYLPFDADEPIAIAMQQISDPIPKLPSHLAALQWFVDIAADKDPKKRFTSVAEFCRVLSDLYQNEESLRGFLDVVTKRSPMNSDTIQRDLSTYDLNHSLGENYPVYPINQEPVESGSVTENGSSSFSLDSLSDHHVDTISLPSEDEFWKTGRILRKLFILLMFLSSLGYAGYYYYYNYSEAGLAERKQQQVADLLKRAQTQMAQSKLSVPKGNNAYESLTRLLALEPNHPKAKQMLNDAAKFYEQRALSYLKQKEFDKARLQIKRGLRFSSQHSGLLKVQALLEKEMSNTK